MPNDHEFFTETMAEIYVDQGNPEKAVEIYRHLLTEQPEREDLAEILAGLEEKISTGGRKRMADLVPLLEEWIELLLKYNNVRKLKKLQERIS